ncbi:DUF4760 domain-containing protein [Chitinophaga silvatica]|uniref:DUF4760 domain-containing protein n=1 Tax=Chitinophaga silvatica TaxID=2282649 RepID=A0A3E1YAG1_9BACT|nr:DUF4760 domain-containing protein [Chitinophaga silvatica]RFS22700.1 DUF4760 domain-containing protein [Chitinophaga silvatica]
MSSVNKVTPRWYEKIGPWVLKNRYIICAFVIFAIAILGCYVYFSCKWIAKDTFQICTSLLLTITLFFTALNYEFSASKTINDYKTAKDILTFNTANEWHKAPLRDYQKTSIDFENRFMAMAERSVEAFDKYFEGEQEFRASLKGIFNFFESTSVGVHKGLIDKQFIFEFFSYIFEIYYVDYYYFIQYYRRKRNRDTIWINFTNLAEEWWPNLQSEVEVGVKKSTIIS